MGDMDFTADAFRHVKSAIALLDEEDELRMVLVGVKRALKSRLPDVTPQDGPPQGPTGPS